MLIRRWTAEELLRRLREPNLGVLPNPSALDVGLMGVVAILLLALLTLSRGVKGVGDNAGADVWMAMGICDGRKGGVVEAVVGGSSRSKSRLL
jgi:hypothetical protein